jgi:hypothetical protein
MITHPPRVRVLALSLVAAAFSLLGLHAQPTIYSDTIGDIAPGISTGGGTLDIIKMEVSDTTTDVIFNLTVNGSVSAVNWGKFMIGVANMKDAGSKTNNGWARPIFMNAGPTNGMTHWIGSWVDGGPAGGAQFFTYNGTNWGSSAALPAFNFATNTNGTSTISYTVSKASLGTTNLGDVINFDAYSSGGGGTDSAVDSLANPSNSITAWAGPYTSGGTNPISSYTLANSAISITNTVTFTVDMNVQESITNFNPILDIVTVAGGWNGFAPGDLAYELVEVGLSGIYEGTFAIPGFYGTSVPYKFAINANLETSPDRTFAVGTNTTPPPLVLPSVFYNNVQGFRDVAFSVDMSVQETLGNYNGTNDVLVVGAFNNWDTTGASGNILTPGSNSVFTGTISNIGGLDGQNFPYKFYSTGMPNSGYENDPNRQLVLQLNTNGSPTPAQVEPLVFWNNQTNVPQSRPVSFSVDMTVQVANGNFNTNSGVVRVIGNFNDLNYDTGNTNYNLTNTGSNIYTGQFAITGDPGITNQYKFFSPGFPVNNGYEIVNPNDIFENRTWVLGPSNVLQTLPLAFWSNDNGGATFTSWSQGAAPNPTNVGLYAIGGASSPTATNGIPPVTLVDTNFLSITAIVRTNNPSLTVIGQATTDLALGPWSTNSVTWSNTVDQSGLPFGTARQIFSVPRTNSSQFLRLNSVLQP